MSFKIIRQQLDPNAPITFNVEYNIIYLTESKKSITDRTISHTHLKSGFYKILLITNEHIALSASVTLHEFKTENFCKSLNITKLWCCEYWLLYYF